MSRLKGANWRSAALWSGGAVIVLALAGAAALHALVDPARLKEIAREKALAAWGRDLAIGEISLALLPVPAVHAESVTLSNAQWGEAPHFVRVERIDARVALLPLLTGKVRLKRLDLAGVDLRLESKDGASNVPSSARGRKVDAEHLEIESLRIRDADIFGTAIRDWHIVEASLDGSLASGDVRVAAISGSKAPLTASASLRILDGGNTIEIAKLDASLGKFRVTGEARVAGQRFEARLESDRMDWAQTMLDLGGRALPALGPDQLFHDVPLAWPLLAGRKDSQGVVDVSVRSLRLRNGIEVTNARSRIAFDDDRMNLDPFSAEMLGGSAAGSMVFEGRKKSVKVDFNGTNLLLQRWFSERGSRIPFTGGSMRVAAKISTSGDTMKALAASVTGPIDIRMGRAVWASEKAGDTEALMTDAFAAKDARRIEFECATAALPFRNGVAAGESLVGFRTTASALATSGEVDLRRQEVALAGRVRARSGVTLGLAAIAGDVKIAGPLRQPKMALDPAAAPGLAARAAAAVATLGISVVGTAAADAAEAAKNDPCAAAQPPGR